jgi:hypothetical protein
MVDFAKPAPNEKQGNNNPKHEVASFAHKMPTYQHSARHNVEPLTKSANQAY